MYTRGDSAKESGAIFAAFEAPRSMDTSAVSLIILHNFCNFLSTQINLDTRRVWLVLLELFFAAFRRLSFNEVLANLLIFNQNEGLRRQSGDPGSPDCLREGSF